MKKCKYCNTAFDNSLSQCPNCGMNETTNICDNCGKEFSEGMHCPSCGVKIGTKEKICPRCSQKYFSTACPSCGYVPFAKEETGNANTQRPMPEYDSASSVYAINQQKQKDKKITLLLCVFFGYFGAHKFYEEKIAMGILYLLTGGLFFIGWIVDIFRILLSYKN